MQKYLLFFLAFSCAPAEVIEKRDQGRACLFREASSNSLVASVQLTSCASPCDNITAASCAIGFESLNETSVIVTSLFRVENEPDRNQTCPAICEEVGAACDISLPPDGQLSFTYGGQQTTFNNIPDTDEIVCIDNFE
jgi:hypothetical protein